MKKYERKSTVKRYSLDTRMEPKKAKCATLRTNNGKVPKKSHRFNAEYTWCVFRVVGQLPKRKYGCFSKTVFFHLRADEYCPCKVKINKSKAYDRNDSIEIGCALGFIGQKLLIDILEKNFERIINICSYNSKIMYCCFTMSRVVFHSSNLNT